MSKIVPKFRFKLEDGMMHYYKDQDFHGYIKSLPDGEYTITVKKRGRPRSDNQNAYYWGVVIGMLAEEFAGDRSSDMLDQIHNAMRNKFLKRVYTKLNKDKRIQVETARSTTELSTVDFEEYMKLIRTWASEELGVYIPLPNEAEMQ